MVKIALILEIQVILEAFKIQIAMNIVFQNEKKNDIPVYEYICIKLKMAYQLN